MFEAWFSVSDMLLSSSGETQVAPVLNLMINDSYFFFRFSCISQD